MYFYKITLACFISLLIFFSFLFPDYRCRLPNNFIKIFASKSKLAKKLNNRYNNSANNYKVDLFREIPFWIFIVLTVVSIIILIFDFSFNNAISLYLGKETIRIIGLSIAVPSLPYIASLMVLIDVFYYIEKKKNTDLNK